MSLFVLRCKSSWRRDDLTMLINYGLNYGLLVFHSMLFSVKNRKAETSLLYWHTRHNIIASETCVLYGVGSASYSKQKHKSGFSVPWSSRWSWLCLPFFNKDLRLFNNGFHVLYSIVLYFCTKLFKNQKITWRGAWTQWKLWNIFDCIKSIQLLYFHRGCLNKGKKCLIQMGLEGLSC